MIHVNIYFMYLCKYLHSMPVTPIINKIQYLGTQKENYQNSVHLWSMIYHLWTMLLYANFCDIPLNVLRPTFFNIYNLPFLRTLNIGKIRVKVGPKTDYSSYIPSSCTNRIAVFNNFFSLICSQPRNKQNRDRDFLLSKYFLYNVALQK